MQQRRANRGRWMEDCNRGRERMEREEGEGEREYGSGGAEEAAEAEERGGRRERGIEDVGVSQKSSIFVVLPQGGAGR